MLSSDDMGDVDEDEESQMKWDVSTQTDIDTNQVEVLVSLHNKVTILERKLKETKFRLSNIKYDTYFLYWVSIFFNFESMLWLSWTICQ